MDSLVLNNLLRLGSILRGRLCETTDVGKRIVTKSDVSNLPVNVLREMEPKTIQKPKIVQRTLFIVPTASCKVGKSMRVET